MTVPPPGQLPFQDHIGLFQFFLSRRDDIVERIQGVLNAQRKPLEYLQDGPLLSRRCEDCFYIGATDTQSHLRGRLEDAHRASGFAPRDLPGLHNGLIDPAEMMIRGFHLWQQTRWPGRAGRLRYAQTLFNLYVLRHLAMLSIRLWDGQPGDAGRRLSDVQGILDELWRSTPSDQPVLVRDARWLIQLAQSPATDDLGAYFDVARRIAETLSAEDRIAVHKAGARMAGGHLRSQIRYYSTKRAVPLDDSGVVLSTRSSNALDFALLIQDLVPLLAAYERSCQSADAQGRLELADAICQGLSPDPELFLNRVELLGAYSMIEHLFITTDRDGQVAYTPVGLRHVHLHHEYDTLIGRVAKPLSDDCGRFRPAAGTYSPYGVLYGFSSDLLEHMAFKTLLPDAVTRFGLEDVFAAGDAETLAWVSGWRKLPHLTPDVQRLFDYPQQFAEDVFTRIEQALHRRVSGDASGPVLRSGRLFVVPANDPEAEAAAAPIPDLPVRYVRSSDRELVAAHKAEGDDERQIASDRREGKYVISYQTAEGWAGITKSILTDVLGAGRDAKITGLPPAAVAALTLLCPALVVRPRPDGTA